MDDYIYDLVVNDDVASLKIKAWFWTYKYVLKCMIWRTKQFSSTLHSIRQYFPNPSFLNDMDEDDTFQFWSFCDYWYFYSTEYLERFGLYITENLAHHDGHFPLTIRSKRVVKYGDIQHVLIGCLEPLSDSLYAKLFEFDYPLMYCYKNCCSISNNNNNNNKVCIVYGLLSLCLLAKESPYGCSISKWLPQLQSVDASSNPLQVEDTRRGPNGTAVIFSHSVLQMVIPSVYQGLKLKTNNNICLHVDCYFC